MKNPKKINVELINEGKEGCIIFCKEQKSFYMLNSTANLIFTYCDGTHTIDEIVEIIASNYKLDKNLAD